MTNDSKAEAVSNLCHAIGNVSRELLAAGVTAEQLAAGLRIEAATIEAAAPRAPMTIEEREVLDVQHRAHEFINTLQVAGLEERTIVAAISNTLIERVARIHRAHGAAMWLRNLATMVDANRADIERSANSH